MTCAAGTHKVPAAFSLVRRDMTTSTSKTRKAREGRPGRKGKLTPTVVRILAYVGAHEGEPCSKTKIAEELGRNQKTIDRLITHLREERLLVVKPTWSKSGGQLANTYRLARNK